MASNFPTPMPQSGAPFVDLNTGRLTLEGYRWALNVWNRTGGAQGSNSAAVLQSANNLSDVASAPAARANLGLGSAAIQPSSAFATAAQGALANTALQPNTNVAVATVVVGGKQVVGAQRSGWSAPTGSQTRGAYAVYGGQTWGASYSQAEAQALDAEVQTLSQTLAALIADLSAHGLIGP